MMCLNAKYLDEAEGVLAQSIWDDLKMLSRKEMVGYRTQKPDEPTTTHGRTGCS